jgi:hypothetical protein
MGQILRAILEKTGIRWFFSSVAVELPAYLLPNFNVTELPAKIDAPRRRSSGTR